jgi:tetratricopeptide (TPR) repeat protein
MNIEKSLPLRLEIEKQLERLLASETFSTSPTPARLLSTLVTWEKKDGEITEHKLGVKVCGKPKDWISLNDSVVRQNAVNLRKLLHKYYSREGKDDLVVIEVPRRQGYTPRYRYNPLTRSIRLCQRATEIFERTFPSLVPTVTTVVRGNLQQSISLNESYAPAYAKLGEIRLFYAICDQQALFPPREEVQEAGNCAQKCLSLDPKNWLGHIVQAAVHCCRFEWEKAEAAFQAALNIDRDKTHSHFFYLCYLAAIGRAEDAVSCSYRRIGSRWEDELAYLPRILLLYIQRRFEEAYDDFVKTSRVLDWLLDGTGFNYQCGWELVFCNYWLTEMLLSCIMLGRENPAIAARYARSGGKASRASAFVGVNVLAYCLTAERGDKDSAERAAVTFHDMELDHEFFSPINFALAYIGLGRDQDAIRELGKACEENHPLMIWLHLWPPFDPLRKYPEFKALIERMRLPTTAIAYEAPAPDPGVEAYHRMLADRWLRDPSE